MEFIHLCMFCRLRFASLSPCNCNCINFPHRSFSNLEWNAVFDEVSGGVYSRSDFRVLSLDGPDPLFVDSACGG